MSLLNEGAIINIYDPKVPENQIFEDIRYSCSDIEFESK